MTATSGNGGFSDPDMILIGELMEEMTRRPPAIGARKLLVEHYISVGWLEAAIDNAKELKKLVPGDSDFTKFLQVLEKKPEPPLPDKKSLPSTSKKTSAQNMERLQWDPKSGRYKKVTASKPVEKKPEVSIGVVVDDLDSSRQDLVTGYQALRAKADFVLADLMHLQTLQKKANLLTSKNITKIQQIVDGQGNTMTRFCVPREIARAMRDNPENAINIAITDMEEAMEWHQTLHDRGADANTDMIRDALVKRKAAIEAALPEDLKIHTEIALMHVEHERLDRNYANTETMYGDDVKDIPRSNFYATEDNYAWDMDELVAAIKASSGVLRNPLSKQMFTPKDVKGIYMHPLATPLATLAVEQQEMSKGVRPDTIVRMEKLSSILLEDQTTDTMPSRYAVDEFLAYVATLPVLEQKAIDGLKCPARDSHTGQAYDSSIGEAVRDAKGNRVCFHKTGDFIGQAATHLRTNRG